MDIDAILDNGGYDIKNPNYNPKTKKGRAQSPYLKTSDMQQAHPFVTQGFSANKEGFMFNADDYQKYIDAGITLNNWESTEKWDKVLADNQSNLSKTVNALGQTVVNEVLLGIPLAVSDLCDIVIGGAIRSASGEETDYSNPVSNFLREKQKEFEEAAPIYVNPEGDTLAEQFSGGLNWGYWMNNLPSIASTITLMVPGLGVSKAAGAITKGIRLNKMIRGLSGAKETLQAGNKLNWLQKTMISRDARKMANTIGSNVTNASVMRLAENYQEAVQTNQESYKYNIEYLNSLSDEDYQDWVSKNPYLKDMTDDKGNKLDASNRDQVAKAIAREAAEKTFKWDMANVVFDVMQVYGLKNAGNLYKRTFKNSNKVLNANKESIRTINKTAEEIAKEEAAKTWYSKLGDKTLGTAKGNLMLFASEGSEGLEEAVNFVAQEEGLTYGKVLLGTESQSSFDDRFKRYWNDPGLWDSAFWGVLGGVGFHKVGSAINAIGRKVEHARKKKGDETTKESLAWYDFGVDNETQDRLNDITHRTERTQIYADRVAKIRGTYNSETGTYSGGVNPDTGQAITEDESKILLQQAEDEYLTDLYISAARNGNLGLLKDFLRSDEVAKYFAANNLGGASKEDIESRIAKLDKIDRMFEDNLRRVDIASSSIGKGHNLFAYDVEDDDGKDAIKAFFKNDEVPLEYLLMIAENNTRAQLKVKEYEELAANERANANAELDALKNAGKVDSTLELENTVKLGVLAQQLGELRLQREEIEKDPAKSKTLSGQIALDNIKHQENVIKKIIYDTGKDEADSISNLLFAVGRSNKYLKDSEGNLSILRGNKTGVVQSFDDFMTSIGALTNEDGTYSNFKTIDAFLLDEGLKPTTTESSEIARRVNMLSQANKNIFSEQVGSARKVAPTAIESFQNTAMLEYLIAQEKDEINLTPDEVAKKIGEFNNDMHEARSNAINGSIETLQNLFDKYAVEGEDSLEELDVLLYDGDDRNITSRMDDSDRLAWRDAMKVLNLTSRNNSSLKRQVLDILSRRSAIKAMMEAGAANVQASTSTSQETQSSSTSQSSVSEPSSPDLNNQSSATQTQANGNVSGQNEEITPKQRTQIGLTINADGTIKENDNASTQIPIKENEDGSYELVVPNDGTQANLLTNTQLFDIQQSVIDGGQVVENPLLDSDEDGNVTVVKRGVIANPDAVTPNTTQPQQQQKETANSEQIGSAAYIPSTGELNPTNPQATEGTYNLSISDATTKVKSRLFKEVNTDSNLDELGESLINELMNDGLTREEANGIVSNTLPRVKAMREKMSGSKSKAVSAVAKLQESNALFMDSPSDEERISNFEQAFKNVIEQYASDMKLNKINGRYYVVTQDLLRYCNDICEDKFVAEALYEGLVKLLDNTGGSTIDYVIIDRSEITSDGFLKKVANSIEANLSQEAQLTDHRVDIMSILRQTPKAEREALYEELEKLNVGDKLYYKLEDDYVLIQAGRRKDSRKTIGRLPLPRRENGAFTWVNRSWQVDVKLDGNNKPVSKLKDFFIDIFAPAKEDKDAQYFNNLLMEYTFGLPADAKKRATRQKEILSELGKLYDTPRFKAFIVDELNDDTIENLTNMLRNLYGPMVAATNANYNASDRKRMVTASLNNWFNKLYESYDFANSLALRKNGTISVSQIHKGRPRFTSGNTRNIASKALTAENKANAKLGVATYEGTIKLSDGSDTGIGASYGSTYVILQNGTDKVTVKAWPTGLMKESSSPKIAKIRQAIEKEIDAAIDAYAKDHNYDRLYKFVDNLFGIQNSGNGMFMSAKDDTNKKKVYAINLQNNLGMKIYFGNRSVTIYRAYSGGVASSNKVQFNDDARSARATGEKTNAKLKQAFREMLNDLNFNVNFKYITSSKFTEGFVSKDDKGKISIKIGDSPAIKFKSFEDMLIGNDLLELSIETNEDGTSNFYRIGEEIEESIKNNKAGQFLRIKLDSTPKEKQESEPLQKVSETQYDENKKEIDKVIASEKTDSSEDGVAIVSKVESEIADKLSNIEYNGESISLLPNKIVLDENMSEVAAFNRSTGVTRISKRTYDNLNSPNRAVRIAGIKSLVHEKIHDILHRDGNEKYVQQIREVYDEAKDAIADMLKKNNLPNPFTADANGNITDSAIEEFITYSLTDSRFANLLNSIDAQGNEVSDTNLSILQRIMKILADLFGWGIRDNSLYAKEFNALRDIMNVEEETTEEVIEKAEEQTQEENVNLSKTEDNLTNDSFWDDESFSIFEDESNETIDTTDNSIEITAVNLDNATKQIPLEERNKFLDSVNKGEISQKCS